MTDATELKLSGEFTMQCEVARGITFAFSDTLGHARSRGELDQAADMFMAVVGRQKAKLDLGEKRAALVIAQAQIKEQAERRVQLNASFQAAHQVSNRRGEFKMSAAQLQSLDQCDQVIKQMQQDIPLIKAQIERLEALVDGRELPEEGPRPLLAAAE
jgi:hypothetical protein